MSDDMLFDDGMGYAADDSGSLYGMDESSLYGADETSMWQLPEYDSAISGPVCTGDGGEWIPHPDDTSIIEVPDLTWPEGPQPSVIVDPEAEPTGPGFDTEEPTWPGFEPEEPTIPDAQTPPLPENHPTPDSGGEFDWDLNIEPEFSFSELGLPSEPLPMPTGGIDELPEGGGYLDELPEFEVPDFFIP